MHLYHGRNTEITELSVVPFVISRHQGQSRKRMMAWSWNALLYPACHMRNSWDHWWGIRKSEALGRRGQRKIEVMDGDGLPRFGPSGSRCGPKTQPLITTSTCEWSMLYALLSCAMTPTRKRVPFTYTSTAASFFRRYLTSFHNRPFHLLQKWSCQD